MFRPVRVPKPVERFGTGLRRRVDIAENAFVGDAGLGRNRAMFRGIDRIEMIFRVAWYIDPEPVNRHGAIPRAGEEGTDLAFLVVPTDTDLRVLLVIPFIK